jgi:hypothetical protein
MDTLFRGYLQCFCVRFNGFFQGSFLGREKMRFEVKKRSMMLTGYCKNEILILTDAINTQELKCRKP